VPVERGPLGGGAEGSGGATSGHRVDRRPAVATDGARDASAASPAPSPSKPAGERPRRIRIVEVSPPSRLTKGGEYEVLGWVGESPSVQFDDGREDFLTESKWEPSPSPREVEIPEEVESEIRAYGTACFDAAIDQTPRAEYMPCIEARAALVSSIRTALAAARGGR
jgi:hypothetical protein